MVRTLFFLLLLHQVDDVVLEGPEPDQRTVPLFSLLKDVGVFEVFLELGSALDAGIADLADLD